MFSRKRIRHMAAQALLVWLFALGLGVANACLLEAGPLDGNAVGAQNGHQHDHSPAHSPQADDKHSPSHGGKSPCSKFCDEPSVGAQNIKHPLNPLDVVALGPIPSVSNRVQHNPPHDGLKPVDAFRWRTAIPVSITFLRLTL